MVWNIKHEPKRITEICEKIDLSQNPQPLGRVFSGQRRIARDTLVYVSGDLQNEMKSTLDGLPHVFAMPDR